MTPQRFTVSDRIPPPARRLESLVQQVTKLPRSRALEAIHSGAVSVGGRVLRRPQAMLEPGDVIEIDASALSSTPAPRELRPRRPARSEVEVLFEDEHLIVVNKPPALLTVPTHYREPHTVISRLNALMKRDDPAAEAFCVHRLDRGVSGVLVFAKTLQLAQAMRDQFADRKPCREYVAFVAGCPARNKGTIRSHLATDEHLNRYSTDDEEAGQLAITHFEVVDRWPGRGDASGVSLVSVRLETGRRNQIRVHMADQGHPVLGDLRYGGERHPLWNWKRLALHAASLGFTHPVTGHVMEFQALLPAEFRELRDRLDRGRKR